MGNDKIQGEVAISFITSNCGAPEFKGIKDIEHGTNHSHNTVLMVLDHTSWSGLLLWDTVAFMSPQHKDLLCTDVKKFLVTELNEHL